MMCKRWKDFFDRWLIKTLLMLLLCCWLWVSDGQVTIYAEHTLIALVSSVVQPDGMQPETCDFHSSVQGAAVILKRQALAMSLQPTVGADGTGVEDADAVGTGH